MNPDKAEIAMLQGLLHEFVSIMRPFALAADAQQHTDCGGIIAQADWEKVAAVVHNYDGLNMKEGA